MSPRFNTANTAYSLSLTKRTMGTDSVPLLPTRSRKEGKDDQGKGAQRRMHVHTLTNVAIQQGGPCRFRGPYISRMPPPQEAEGGNRDTFATLYSDLILPSFQIVSAHILSIYYPYKGTQLNVSMRKGKKRLKSRRLRLHLLFLSWPISTIRSIP